MVRNALLRVCLFTSVLPRVGKCTRTCAVISSTFVREGMARTRRKTMKRREKLHVLLTVALYQRRRRQRKRKARTVWVREIFKRRKTQGEFHNLVQEMRLCDRESHFKYFRMTRERFDHLLSLVRYNLYTKVLIISHKLYIGDVIRLGLELCEESIGVADRPSLLLRDWQ